MLYLNPPFYFIDGVSLLPDHADPLQWYYLPMAPHLTTVPDATSGKPVPSIQLLLMRPPVPAGGTPAGEAPAPDGGFLNFDVNLGIPSDRLSSLAGKLQSQAQLRDLPRLAPVPVVDGSVHLIILGKESELPGPPSTRPKPPDGSDRFVVKIAHAAKPSLYGDQQATFGVELTKEGAIIMSQALEGAITGIGVVYSLDYVALRPAYTVKLEVDWDRVQTQLDERFGYSGVFLSVEIDEMVDKLIDNRSIKLEATLFVPEGPDAGSTITDFQKAKAEVREMITSAFFTPSIEPPTAPAPDGWDKAAGFANRISQLAVTGGLSALGGFSYKKTDYTRIDRKSLDVVMSERSAVRRSIWPQGQLTGLTSLVRESGLPMDRFIIWIDLDADFYKTRKVTLKPIGFAADANILSVTVHVTYGATTHSASFGPNDTTSQDLHWASVLDAQGNMIREVEYHYTVNFGDVPGLTRPRTYETPKRTTVNDVIDIYPPADVPYAVVPIPVTTTRTVPWDRWAGVDVDLRYEDPANGIVATDHRTVVDDTPGDPWKLFRLDDTKRSFQARLHYRGKPDRRDHLIDWHDVKDEQVRVGNPYDRNRKVQVVPSVDWNLVDRVFVDLTYEDPANSLSYSQSMTFTATAAGSPEPQDFATDIVDVEARRVDFTVTILFKDGSQKEVPTSATLKDRIIVTEEMIGNRVVVVKAGTGEFTTHDLASITVSLKHVDPSGTETADDVVLTAEDRVGSFEFPYSESSELSFSYGLKYRYGSGLSQAIDPVTTNDDTVVVPVK